MNIFIMARSAKYGGIATYTENLINFLIKHPNQNTYFIVIPDVAWAKKFKEAKNPHLNFIIKNSQDSWFQQFFWQQIGISILIKKHNIDILFSTANFGTFFSPCKQILLIRIPIYFSQLYIKHILPKKLFFEKIDFYLRKFLIFISALRSNVIMFPTQSMKDDFIYYSGPYVRNKIMVVNYYGTLLEKLQSFRNLEKIDSEKFKIMYISHYTDYKNYTTLFRALEILVREGFHNFECITSIDFESPVSKSSITYRQDYEFVNSMPLRKYILNKGILPYEEILALYQTIDVFVWPTLTESFGHPVVEAMAAGCPILSSDIPINRELCGDAVVYFKPFDHNNLALNLKKVLIDGDLRKGLIKKGKKQSFKFNWNDHCFRLQDIFKKMITS